MKKVEVDIPAPVVNPKDIFDMGAVRPFDEFPAINIDIDHPDCALQQNGIDLRLAEVYVAAGSTSFRVDKTQDNRCSYHPIPLNNDNSFYFEVGKQYSVDFMEWIEVPKDMMAYVFVRSSVNRYSGNVVTGLWDQQFKGRLGAIFRPSVPTRMEYGFRMAQVVFFYADGYRPYTGQYLNQTSHRGLAQ